MHFEVLYGPVRLNRKKGTTDQPESNWIKAIESADDSKDDVLDDPGDGIHAFGTNQHYNSDQVEEG